jgi:AraC-like DNA-binding protein
MTYFEHIPTGLLSKYIDKFWYCQADDLTHTTMTIPLLYHELVFNFSHNYSISHVPGYDNILNNTTSWICGIQKRPVISKSAGKHEMMGVLFKPNGLKAFTKYHASDFAYSFIEADLVFDTSFAGLIDQLQNVTIAKDKISLIENYLVKNLNPDHTPAYLTKSLDLFGVHSDEKIYVKDTCSEISISKNSLIKSYQKHIGISPVKYLQLLSINKALSKLSIDPQQSLTKLAYDLNFYDQAHFIHLFKSTTNITPKQYADFVDKNKIDESSPNFISFQG